MISSRNERLYIIKHIFVDSPFLRELREDIRICKDDSKLGGEPECMLITGDSGSGKSTVIKKFMLDYPSLKINDTKITPVLFSELPMKATTTSTASQMLKALGDSFYDKESHEIKITDRLVHFLKECQVELIILDELQRLIRRENLRSLEYQADWIKFIIDETGIPIILVGMPWSTKILDMNSQLESQFLVQKRILPFILSDENSCASYYQFLKIVDELLPFESPSGLDDENTAIRLFSFCSGNKRKLMKLTLLASRKAISNNHDLIHNSDFGYAANLLIAKDKGQVNPFNLSMSRLPILEYDIDTMWDNTIYDDHNYEDPKPTEKRSLDDIFRQGKL